MTQSEQQPAEQQIQMERLSSGGGEFLRKLCRRILNLVPLLAGIFIGKIEKGGFCYHHRNSMSRISQNKNVRRS